MASGSKRVVINNLERAVSDDINRLQSFKDRMHGEFARYLFGVAETNADDFGGVVTESLPGAVSPATKAGVINGLMAQPINGTINLLVTPGLIYMEDVAYDVNDDSMWRYIRDPGVAAVGTLNLTPGPVAARVDVIECQYVDTVVEQDNRDIYDVGTGLFTAVLKDKAKEARLNYRIRTGVAGGGFPGLEYGWVPLAVAVVAAGAATWDDVTLYDVRPLVSKLWRAPFQAWPKDTDVSKFLTAGGWDVTGTKLICTGKFEGNAGPFRVNGLLKNHPSGTEYFDAADHTFWQAGLAAMTNGVPFYIWSLMPFLLPYWRKYTDATVSPRKPTGLCGVMTVSQVGPTPRGLPAAAIALPSATGLGGTCQFGCVVACGVAGTGSVKPFYSDGDWVAVEGAVAAVPTTTAPETSLGGISQYNITDGIVYPANARGLRIKVTRNYTYAPPVGEDDAGMVFITPRIVDPATGSTIATLPQRVLPFVFISGSGSNPLTFEIEIPIFYNIGAAGIARRLEINFVHQWGITIPTSVAETGQIHSFKMAP